MGFQHPPTHHYTTTTLKLTSNLHEKNVTRHPKHHIILTHQISDKSDRALYRWHLSHCVHHIVHSIQSPVIFRSLKSLFLPPSLQTNNFLSKHVCDYNRFCRIAHLHKYLYIQTLPTPLICSEIMSSELMSSHKRSGDMRTNSGL